MVWVVQAAGRDSYKNTDHVGINAKRSQQASLYSCTKDGTPTTALTDLPRYQSRTIRHPRRSASVGQWIEHVPPKQLGRRFNSGQDANKFPEGGEYYARASPVH